MILHDPELIESGAVCPPEDWRKNHENVQKRKRSFERSPAKKRRRCTDVNLQPVDMDVSSDSSSQSDAEQQDSANLKKADLSSFFDDLPDIDELSNVPQPPKWVPGKSKTHILKWCEINRKKRKITPKILMRKFGVTSKIAEECASTIGWSLENEILYVKRYCKTNFSNCVPKVERVRPDLEVYEYSVVEALKCVKQDLCRMVLDKVQKLPPDYEITPVLISEEFPKLDPGLVSEISRKYFKWEEPPREAVSWCKKKDSGCNYSPREIRKRFSNVNRQQAQHLAKKYFHWDPSQPARVPERSSRYVLGGKRDPTVRKEPSKMRSDMRSEMISELLRPYEIDTNELSTDGTRKRWRHTVNKSPWPEDELTDFLVDKLQTMPQDKVDGTLVDDLSKEIYADTHQPTKCKRKTLRKKILVIVRKLFPNKHIVHLPTIR